MSEKSKLSHEIADETRNTGDWTDDEGEVRELTEAEIASMQPFSSLPPELQTTLRGLRSKGAFSTDEDKISVPVSRSVVEGFRAHGEDWQSRLAAVAGAAPNELRIQRSLKLALLEKLLDVRDLLRDAVGRE